MNHVDVECGEPPWLAHNYPISLMSEPLYEFDPLRIFIWKGIMTICSREDLSIIRWTTTHLLDPQEYGSNLHTIISHPNEEIKKYASFSTSTISLVTTKIMYIQKHNEFSLDLSSWEYASVPTPSSLIPIKNKKYASWSPHQPSRHLHQSLAQLEQIKLTPMTPDAPNLRLRYNCIY